MLINYHTHHKEEGNMVESRLSYRPSEVPRADGLYSLGLHPCYPEDMTHSTLNLLRRRIAQESDKVWAIGEAGLDKLSQVNLDLQTHYFIAQIELSEFHQKPLVIHCVKAYSEVIALKKQLQPKQDWIIHGFRRGNTLAKQLLDSGISLSFGYYFDEEALHLAASRDKIYLETDDMPVSIKEVYSRVQQSLNKQQSNLDYGTEKG